MKRSSNYFLAFSKSQNKKKDHELQFHSYFNFAVCHCYHSGELCTFKKNLNLRSLCHYVIRRLRSLLKKCFYSNLFFFMGGMEVACTCFQIFAFQSGRSWTFLSLKSMVHLKKTKPSRLCVIEMDLGK